MFAEGDEPDDYALHYDGGDSSHQSGNDSGADSVDGSGLNATASAGSSSGVDGGMTRSSGRSTQNKFNAATVVAANSAIASSTNLRKGKWTLEEEAYTNKIISMFNRGKLPIPPGTTLRSYLSDKLNCDPMRITKKFAGATSIGKVVYQPAESMLDGNKRQEDAEIEELRVLETLFLDKLNGKPTSSAAAGSSSSSSSSANVGSSIELQQQYHQHQHQQSARQSSLPPRRDSREATSPATAKITEVVEKIRANDRGLRYTAAERGRRDDSTLKREGDNSMMKRIVSAPNFSELSSLQLSWKGKTDLGNTDIMLKNDFDYAAAYSPSYRREYATGQERHFSRQGNNRSPRGLYDVDEDKFGELGGSPLMASKSSLYRSKKRAQSVMDLNQYEDFMMNDLAAGDLLLQFSANLRDRHLANTLDVKPVLASMDLAEQLLPPPHYVQIESVVEQHSIGVAFRSHIESPALKSSSPSLTPSSPTSLDVGLSLEDDHGGHYATSGVAALPSASRRGTGTGATATAAPSLTGHDLLVQQAYGLSLHDRRLEDSGEYSDIGLGAGITPLLKRSRSNDLMSSLHDTTNSASVGHSNELLFQNPCR